MLVLNGMLIFFFELHVQYRSVPVAQYQNPSTTKRDDPIPHLRQYHNQIRLVVSRYKRIPRLVLHK